MDTSIAFKEVHDPKYVLALLTAMLGFDLRDVEFSLFSMIDIRLYGLNHEIFPEYVVFGYHNTTLFLSINHRLDSVLLKRCSIALSLYDGLY